MSEMNPNDPGADFTRSLLDAGKEEQPPAGAPARILKHVAGAAPVAARASGVVAKGVWSVVAFAAVAAASGAVAFATRAPARAPAVADAPLATVARTVPAPLAAPASPPSTHTPAARGATACERVDLPDTPPTVCSTAGRREALEMVNSCADDVDVFWVDFKCRETFVARVTPGQQLNHATFDTHPWRVRDHATHKLIKEWVGPRLPEPPKDPVELPDVVIRDGVVAPDGPPKVCSHPSDPAKVRFVNQRTTGVSIVFWVDYECHEQIGPRIEPGETSTQETFDAHPFRVRDENGNLLVDYVPDGADRTVYVSLP